MTDKDFGRKPKFAPVAKKGSPKPPPKTYIMQAMFVGLVGAVRERPL